MAPTPRSRRPHSQAVREQQMANPDEATVAGGAAGGEDQEDGDFISLVERIHPAIPPPNPAAGRVPDSDGWSLINRIGAWNCTLCPFATLQQVPEEHEEVYIQAWETVLERYHLAATSEDRDMALMWRMFLAQGLLRRPSRGGRAGRGQVAKRFRCLQRGDWGSLVELWEQDRTALGTARDLNRREESEEEKDARVAKESLSFISDGQIRMAARRLRSDGVADSRDEEVLQLLRGRYPPRSKDFPDRVVRGDPVPNLAGLR